ncbi:MAG: hypothetical protein SNJ59_03000 [Aggregatilineales bacterium]
MAHNLPAIFRFFGVDFSGAADAGRKIRIAALEARGGAFDLLACFSAADLPGGGLPRDAAIGALRDFIAAQGPALFGLDFPFSLAAELIGRSSWEDFARHFAEDYPTAQHLFDHGRRAANGARRQTDGEARTPFAPHNLRLYRQTYYGIRDLLAPLALSGRAVVLPMQAPAVGRPWLLEMCPATTLKSLNFYAPYKGRTPAHRQQRQNILNVLVERGLRLPAVLQPVLLDDAKGDALDSVIAGFAAAIVYERGFGFITNDARYQLEGVVYGWLD